MADSGGTRIGAQQALRQAARHLDAGRGRDGEALVRGVLRDEPDNHEALFLLGAIALRAGKPADAVKILSRAIRHHDGDSEYHRLLGVALLTTGKQTEGEAALGRALAIKPGDPMANFNAGQQDLAVGRFAEARRRLERAARKLPKDPGVLLALGVALARCGEPARAVRHFRTVLRARPDDLDARLNLAGALTEMGKAAEAVPIFEALVAAHADHPRLQFNLGVALSAARRGSDAIGCFEKALALDPQMADAHVNLSAILTDRGCHQEALHHIRTARELRADDPRIAANEAGALMHAGRMEDALVACRRAADLDPDEAEVRATEIIVLQNQGRFDRAREAADRFLAGHPDAVPVLYAMTYDRAYGVTEAQRATLSRVAGDGSADPYTAARAAFALGNIHRDSNETDRAFACYARANTLRNAEFPWTEDDESAWFAGLENTFTADFVRSRAALGRESGRPVFVVGMPRSGTTLVERILAAHPDAATGGELSHIHAIAEALTDYPRGAANLDESSARRLAESYLQVLAGVSGTAARVVDKMPDNYQHLGLIALMLPGARVIWCRRDPMATCLSIFQQNFTGYHPYAYDLGRLGRRFRNHERLMAHWQQVLPLPILEVAYEDVVADQEGQSRRILEFCGLDWDESVLRFHEAGGAVRTASRWQVRQPIYTASLDGWRAFETHLGPLRDALESP